jgi:ATP-dependent Clp protease ATP-binding subunit ClpX
MKTGARALRSIMETIMLDVMYDLPAIDGCVEVVISAGVVKGKAKAKINPIETEKLDAA